MSGAGSEVLQNVMSTTGTTQSELARLSGMHQPSISQFLSGKINMSDEQLSRLLGCMGYKLEIELRATSAELTRSEHSSWLLHRALARRLDQSSFMAWLPIIRQNLTRLESTIQGEPHLANLAAWTELISRRDLIDLKKALTGLDRRAIEMREVSPFAGIMNDEERLAVLRRGSDAPRAA